MNAIEKALDKVDAEIERITLRLGDVDNAYDYKRGEYKYDQYTRQGARSLAGHLVQAAGLTEDAKDGADGSFVTFGASQLRRIAAMWVKRDDWRQGALAANVNRAVERLVGLS